MPNRLALTAIFLVVTFAVGFSLYSLKNSKETTDREAAALLTALPISEPPEISTARECVQIFYDRPKAAPDRMGRAYAIMLTNLLGHFPRYTTSMSPVEFYRKGQLDKCKANFYIGSTYENPLPAAFYADVLKTKSQMVWIGDSFWKLGQQLSKTFGVKFEKSEQEDKAHRRFVRAYLSPQSYQSHKRGENHGHRPRYFARSQEIVQAQC